MSVNVYPCALYNRANTKYNTANMNCSAARLIAVTCAA
jgi:hypothetical protein